MYKIRDFENAEKYFEEALKVIKGQGAGGKGQEMDDGYRSVVIGYGEMLINFKKYKKAKELFGEYLKANPSDNEVKEMFSKCEGILEKINRLGQVVGKITHP